VTHLLRWQNHLAGRRQALQMQQSLRSSSSTRQGTAASSAGCCHLDVLVLLPPLTLLKAPAWACLHSWVN
jgi:hypothetical protein